MDNANNTNVYTVNGRGKNLFIPFLIALATLLVYLPALNNGFVDWDDDGYVTRNLNIRTFDAAFLKWSLTSIVVSNWHPLTMISHAMDYALWGTDPWGHHLTSVILHVLNTGIIYFLVYRLVSWKKAMYGHNEELNKIALFTASFSSLLFGLHPLHVESVAWVSERKDVLSTFFYLLSIVAYLQYVNWFRWKSLYYILSIICYVLALMSKPMAISLPVVLLILDYYPLERGRMRSGQFLRVAVAEKLPYILLSVLVVIITMATHKGSGSVLGYNLLPFTTRLLVASYASVFYIVKMFLPFNLAPFYPHPIKLSPLPADYIVFLSLWIIILFYAIRSAWRNKGIIASWLYFMVTVLPVIGIIQTGRQAVADRYFYLPSVSPFIISGIAVSMLYISLDNRFRKLMIVSLFLIGLLMTHKTFNQIGIWKDSVALWTHELKVIYNPSHLPRNNYMMAYWTRGAQSFIQGNYRDAIKDFSSAIDKGIPNADIYFDRGRSYLLSGDFQHAVEDFERSIQLNPQDAETYLMLGFSYSRAGKSDDAQRSFRKSVELGSLEARKYDKSG